MTYEEETITIETLKQIKKEVHENNIMLRQICQVINNYLRNFNQENVDDFGKSSKSWQTNISFLLCTIKSRWLSPPTLFKFT